MNQEQTVELLEKSRQFNIWGNPNKHPKANQQNACEYCGKKHGAMPLMVHITYVGTCVPNGVTEKDLEDIESSQGCFAIGSTCAENLFGSEMKKYTFKFNDAIK